MLASAPSVSTSLPLERDARPRGFLGRLRDRWMNFWFAPATPSSLGFYRFLFFFCIFVFHVWDDSRVWHNVPREWFQPIWIFKFFHWKLLSPGKLLLMETVWKIALFFACIGFFTRLSAFIGFAFGLYLLGLANCWGKTGHGDAMVTLLMCVFAIARSGDGWSIDSLLRAARRRDTSGAAPPLSGEYTWPVRCGQLVLSMVFFNAGCTKLIRSGLAWVTSDNMAILLIQHHFSSAPLTDLGLKLAQHPLLCKIMAGGSLATELSFPLALISKWARRIVVPACFMMQVGIGIFMGIYFTQFMVCYLFFVPWPKIGRWIVRRNQREPVADIFFDGTCGLCQGTVAVVRRLDLLCRVRFRDIAREWPEVSAAFPQLDYHRCMEDMHLIDRSGRLHVGFDAYRYLARILPLGWIFLPFLYLPGVRAIGVRVYSFIASRRAGIACAVAPRSP
ncbi:MAG TPA: DCC1-like thiol-disulfide oxidoreductase family protein [Tepidisphaeraceae bacterium]|nr:DCC1-like thiol-disulfide oxidoreductase family protein [Tepidisphaeraceae bacterium]